MNGVHSFYREDGHYVIRENNTNDIILISNGLDLDWKPDPTIINPYIPKK